MDWDQAGTGAAGSPGEAGPGRLFEPRVRCADGGDALSVYECYPAGCVLNTDGRGWHSRLGGQISTVSNNSTECFTADHLQKNCLSRLTAPLACHKMIWRQMGLKSIKNGVNEYGKRRTSHRRAQCVVTGVELLYPTLEERPGSVTRARHCNIECTKGRVLVNRGKPRGGEQIKFSFEVSLCQLFAHHQS